MHARSHGMPCSNAATQQRSNADRPSPCKRLLKAVHPPPQRGSAQPHKTWSGGRLPACLLRSTASPSSQGQHAAQLAADVQHARCEVTAQPVSIASRFESPRLCASQLGLRRSCEGAAKELRRRCEQPAQGACGAVPLGALLHAAPVRGVPAISAAFWGNKPPANQTWPQERRRQSGRAPSPAVQSGQS